MTDDRAAEASRPGRRGAPDVRDRIGSLIAGAATSTLCGRIAGAAAPTLRARFEAAAPSLRGRFERRGEAA